MKATQTQRVYESLSRGFTLTPLESWTRLGVYRLSARVHDLRRMGVPIRSTMVEVENRFGETARVKRYWLEPRHLNKPLEIWRGEREEAGCHIGRCLSR